MINEIKYLCGLLGALVGVLFGKGNEFVLVLLAFVVFDYVTGVICAIHDKKLSSEVGFKGIGKKIIIFIIVSLAHLLDTYILKNAGGDTLCVATCFFYIANEGISILENASKLGLPVPTKIKNVLEQIKEKE